MSYEKHYFEISRSSDSDIDINKASEKLHKKMEERLSEKQFKVYKLLFIDGLSEEETARKVGYKTSEKGRKAGYGQITNLKKIFKREAELILEKEEIFFDI